VSYNTTTVLLALASNTLQTTTQRGSSKELIVQIKFMLRLLVSMQMLMALKVWIGLGARDKTVHGLIVLLRSMLMTLIIQWL